MVSHTLITATVAVKLVAVFQLVVVVVSLSRLGLWRCPSLAAAFFLLNNRHSSGNEFHASIAAVGSSMQFAVVVQVVLTIELILSAKLAREAIGAFTMVSR